MHKHENVRSLLQQKQRVWEREFDEWEKKTQHTHQPHIVIECHTGIPDLNLCINTHQRIHKCTVPRLNRLSLVSSYSIFSIVVVTWMGKIGFCFCLLPLKSLSKTAQNKCEWHKQSDVCGRVSATTTTFANSFRLVFFLSTLWFD